MTDEPKADATPTDTSEPKRFTLRPYQKDAIEAVAEARSRGVQRMAVCLPTGAGKTVIFSRLAAKDASEGRDVLVLAHREELLSQAKDKLERALQGTAKVDIEQGANRAAKDARVVVCSIRSLREDRLKRLIKGRNIGLVIYDECHHAAAEDNKRVLRQLGAYNPRWSGTLLGFTATTQRGDGIGLEVVFEEIVYSRSILEMVEDGYLTPLRGFRISTQADLRALTSSGADFKIEELAEAVDIEERNALVARSVQELARDRRTIVFCVTVNHARNLARALNHLGVRAGLIHGEMKSEDRAQVLADFREDRLQVITNVAVLTEGFDDPAVSCIAMARPTKSSGLYAQCVGRGTRLFPGKKDCLVLDFVDLSDLSLVTLPSLFGMPRHIDLEGEEVTDARAMLHQLSLDYPHFEMEAEAITLDEIKLRAESFDPLTLDLHPNIRAISGNAWCSLGASGLVLYFHRNRKKLSEALVLDSQQRGKSRYQVFMDQDNVASFSTLEKAVEAVDYEVDAMGPIAAQSARPDASWRSRPVTDGLKLKLQRLKPPRFAATCGEALRCIAYGTYARRRKLVRRF